MYWPYFRSKTNEVLAIRDLAPSLTDIVVPIIKPATSVSSLQARVAEIVQKGLRVAIVVNSDEGAPVPTHVAVKSMIAALERHTPDKIFPAFEIDAGTTGLALNRFCKSHSQSQTVIIHRNHHIPPAAFVSPFSNLALPPVHIFFEKGIAVSTINAITSSRKVLLRDGFQKQAVNGSYPSSSNFGDLIYQYGSSGCHGFSDCGPVGDVFQSGGSAPSHVALHLTENVPGPTLACNHFVSAVSTTANTETKYFDALDQLVQYTGSPGRGQFATAGVADFCGSQTTAHFPGLGLPKRWSIKHHVEMVHNILVSNGTLAFV